LPPTAVGRRITWTKGKKKEKRKEHETFRELSEKGGDVDGFSTPSFVCCERKKRKWKTPTKSTQRKGEGRKPPFFSLTTPSRSHGKATEKEGRKKGKKRKKEVAVVWC